MCLKVHLSIWKSIYFNLLVHSNIGVTTQQNIRLDEDVFRLRLQKTSSRRLDQDEYVRLSLTSSELVLMTSSRRLGQDQYICLGHMFSRRFEDVLKRSSRPLQGVFKTFWRRLQDVFKTSSRLSAKILSRRFQGVPSS